MPVQTNVYRTNLIIFLFACVLTYPAHAQQPWQSLSPGVEYMELTYGMVSPWSRIHVFRIDLHSNQLQVVTAKQLALPNATAYQFARASHALLSINGGFFDKNFHPLGLRISNHVQANPIKPISWWGVFYIKNNKAHISSLSHFKPSDAVAFAVQSGPRLLVQGKIPSLKAGSADRTALGITAQGKIIAVVSSNAALSTEELAQLMKAHPLSCVQAINLDGGSSSQVYAHAPGFRLNVPGYGKVSDAIVVKPT